MSNLKGTSTGAIRIFSFCPQNPFRSPFINSASVMGAIICLISDFYYRNKAYISPSLKIPLQRFTTVYTYKIYLYRCCVCLPHLRTTYSTYIINSAMFQGWVELQTLYAKYLGYQRSCQAAPPSTVDAAILSTDATFFFFGLSIKLSRGETLLVCDHWT